MAHVRRKRCRNWWVRRKRRLGLIRRIDRICWSFGEGSDMALQYEYRQSISCLGKVQCRRRRRERMPHCGSGVQCRPAGSLPAESCNRRRPARVREIEETTAPSTPATGGVRVVPHPPRFRHFRRMSYHHQRRTYSVPSGVPSRHFGAYSRFHANLLFRAIQEQEENRDYKGPHTPRQPVSGIDPAVPIRNLQRLPPLRDAARKSSEASDCEKPPDQTAHLAHPAILAPSRSCVECITTVRIHEDLREAFDCLSASRSLVSNRPQVLPLLPRRGARILRQCPGMACGSDQRASSAGAITPSFDHSSSWFLTASAAVALGLSSRNRRKWVADD